jgi:hypothetical protein
MFLGVHFGWSLWTVLIGIALAFIALGFMLGMLFQKHRMKLSVFEPPEGFKWARSPLRDVPSDHIPTRPIVERCGILCDDVTGLALGELQPAGWYHCPVCHGKGHPGGIVRSPNCPRCSGSGVVIPVGHSQADVICEGLRRMREEDSGETVEEMQKRFQ